MRAADTSALADLFDRLSPESRHSRFLGPKGGLTRRELESLADLDRPESEAFALVAPDGRFVCVARYGPVPDDPDAAEVAVTVADDWQGCGIGGAMASLLVAAARRRRILRLEAMTLAQNSRCGSLLRRLGFTATTRDGPVITFEKQLGQTVSPP